MSGHESPSPFGNLAEARMRILGQYEYEGRLDGPITMDTLMEMHREVMRYAPDTPGVVFGFEAGGSNP